MSIFPVVGHICIAQDESDQISETCLGTNIVRQDQNATLAFLNADHGVDGLIVVSAFEKPCTCGPTKAITPRPAYRSFRCSLAGTSGRKRGNSVRVVMCSEGLVISARDADERPSPRTRAAVNFARSEIVVFIEPAARTLLRLE